MTPTEKYRVELTKLAKNLRLGSSILLRQERIIRQLERACENSLVSIRYRCSKCGHVG